MVTKNILISASVIEKLCTKHRVERREIEQCFANRSGGYLQDTREDHQTTPPTLWFGARTNKGRLLKVVFIYIDGNIHIKSAFEPNAKEISIYERCGR
ncbi:MAG: hypothetical protein KF778_15950 [Rhodocyclaceae bacterium]|nr:hypothetical protein [Rhodocyclaceae bacterium]MBX3669894.1 hypothetical protein [Rhodocyclaceae bacterium]